MLVMVVIVSGDGRSTSAVVRSYHCFQGILTWITLTWYNSVSSCSWWSSFAEHQAQTLFSGWWRISPSRIPVSKKKKCINGNKTQVLEIINLSLPSYMNTSSLYFSGGLAHRESDRCSGLHLSHLGPCAHPEGRWHLLPLSGELLDQHAAKRISNLRSQLNFLLTKFNR